MTLRKLSGLDASFLYNETSATPMHIGSLQMLDVPEDQRVDYYERLKALYSNRVHLLPHLTSKLRFDPLRIDHPVWIRDSNFDIDNHFERVTLPAPGNELQLNEVVAALYEPRLNRSRPLWKCWLIDGLESGEMALLTKTHHACIDGQAGIAAIEVLSDPTEAPRTVEPAPQGFWKQPTPRPEQLATDAWVNLACSAIDQWSQLPRNLRLAREGIQQLRSNAAAYGSTAMMAPAALWNRGVDKRRGFAALSVSLPEVKAIARQTNAKVNDVVLAVAAGAIDRYLGRQQRSRRGALLGACPVSLRTAGDTSMNNQVTMMTVDMCRDVSDPLKRVAAIHRTASVAKKNLAATAGLQNNDVASPFLPAIAENAARGLSSARAALDLATQVPASLVISNVPGPRNTVYVAGARMTTSYPISIVAQGSGLNVTVCSYGERMEIGLTVATRAIPDVHRLRDDFQAAWEALVSRAREAQGEIAPAARAA